MSSQTCVIVGGGIAGLWLLARLRSEGIDAWLLEKNALGAGQTIASQGIIHGGLKYSLGGVLSRETQAISSLPQRWRRHFSNQLQPHLGDVKILQQWQYLLVDSGIKGALLRMLASAALVGRTEQVDIHALQLSKPMTGIRIHEDIVDVRSLLHVLFDKVSQYCKQYTLRVRDIDTSGNTWKITINGIAFEPGLLVFAAGEGNSEFMGTDAMQLRPLHMICVRHNQLFTLYAHILGTSNKPLCTISSHQYNGMTNWYIGGEIAEQGIALSSEQQCRRCREMLSVFWKDIDWNSADWKSFLIARAEGKTTGLLKPQTATIHNCADNALAVFPTKLTFAPELADRVLNACRLTGGKSTMHKAFVNLPQATVADYLW